MKIGVIMGGISSEREISLKSGEQVIKSLNKDKYEKIIPIIINSKEEVIEKVPRMGVHHLPELFKGILLLFKIVRYRNRAFQDFSLHRQVPVSSRTHGPFY